MTTQQPTAETGDRHVSRRTAPRGERGAAVLARVPRATYRWQFNREFTFRDARRLIGYLADLGISDIYASPYLRASADSTHGYDVANHNQLNPAIGSEANYQAYIDEVQRRGLGQVLDIVPNHMGIAEAANIWWMDVLENGPSSPYANFFDISWRSLKPELRDKVLLPILGDQYGIVLENSELVLTYQDGGLFLSYYETLLPIAPGTYGHVLQPCLGALAAELDPADERLLELQSVLTAIANLPKRRETDAARVAERQREKEIIKRRLDHLVTDSPEVRRAVEATLRLINGVQGQPTSFDRLDALLDDQAYRLAFWRVASEEINYRRFFDINSLAAIRVERPEVFRETHRLILELLRSGAATGLRIDHPDGLWDPAAYLHQLQTSYLEALGDGEAGQKDGELPLFVVVEKILGRGEELPHSWATHGTTGYEFAISVGGLFVDQANRRAFDDLYARFIGRRLNFRDLVNTTKKMIMLVSLSSEVNALANRLNELSERHRRFRDFTINSLTFAIREVIAALPVYRTYSTCDSKLRKPDQEAVEAAVAEAKRRNPRTETSIFNFIRDLLLLRYPAGDTPADRAAQCEFVMKFQQTTGPVMAKGVEDTAFYVYNRLVALNEVGGEPDHFGTSVAEFHRQNAARQHRWPHSMLSTSTHDTKRSEDVRSRIAVLSELPREWQTALGRWSRFNARARRRLGSLVAPDRNDEYLLYQILLGAWPFDADGGTSVDTDEQAAAVSDDFVQRIQAYMEKALHEAKVHTSWINPNHEYDEAVREFVKQILDENRSVNFLASFRPLQLKVAHYGLFNSLSQVLLKLSVPGVPDIYQGNEFWDFSLVDPDNRRKVDYAQRRRLLTALRKRIDSRDGDLAPLCRDLLESREDARIKLYLTHRVLTFRERQADLFQQGRYDPLTAKGPRAENVVAFARSHGDEQLIVVAPRLYTRLAPYPELPLGTVAWGETRLLLDGARPASRYRDVFSGLIVEVDEQSGQPGLNLATILEHFPVAMLEHL